MTVEEAKKALGAVRAQLKADGYKDEDEIDRVMIAMLGGMFIEDEIDVNQLDALMGLVGKGYELPEDFKKLSTEEQKKNFFKESDDDDSDYSKEEVEEIEKAVVDKKDKDDKDDEDNEEKEREEAKKLFGF